MFDPRRFSQIVGMIYDCVAEPAGWPDVLGVLTDEFEGKIATLAVLDTATKASRFSATYGDPAILEPLITTYAQDMPFYDVVPKAPIDVPITMAQLAAMHGPNGYENFQQSRLWSEWFVPHNIGDAFCTSILRNGVRIGAIVINVDRLRRPISVADIERLSLVIPHIRRAVTIGDLFEQERGKGDLFRRTVDALSIPVLIVGGSLQVRYVNPAAEALLARNDNALGVAGGRLVVNEPRSRKAMEDCVAIGLRNEAALGSRAIGLPLPGPPPLVAHVLPLRDRRSELLFGGDAAAAIFVAAPGISAEPAIEAMASLFGLTGAERQVAAQVARGMNRQSIAAANNVADGTVKSQLDAIYDKTGTSNQRELDRLLRDLTPPLRQP